VDYIKDNFSLKEQASVSNRLIFGTGITFDMLTFVNLPNTSGDMAIQIHDASGALVGEVIIDNWYHGYNVYHYESWTIGFEDRGAFRAGSVFWNGEVYWYDDATWDDSVIWINGEHPFPTNGHDTLVGSAFSEDFYGLNGDDILDARGGDDMLRTGPGLNTLFGGSGSDSYIIASAGLGDVIIETPADFEPNDVNSLHFPSDITPSDLTYMHLGVDLYIRIGFDDIDFVKVADWSYYADFTPIQEFHFSDGTILQTSDLTDLIASHAANVDYNGDGFLDWIQFSGNMDWLNFDHDGDGVLNAVEQGTNLFSADSDGDGVDDSSDLSPLDPTRSSAPDPVPAGPLTLSVSQPFGAIVTD